MTWIRMEREFKQLTKNMWGLRFLVTLYCIWTLDYGAGYWSTVNVKYGRRANCNNCNLRDEPQQVYFLISRDIYFIQWKVTTQLNSTQQLGVCCLLGTSQQTAGGGGGFFDSFSKYDVVLSLFFVCIKLNTHLICSIHHDIEGHKKYQSNIKHKLMGSLSHFCATLGSTLLHCTVECQHHLPQLEVCTNTEQREDTHCTVGCEENLIESCKQCTVGSLL